VDSITLAGVTFHRYTEKVTGWGPETRRERVQGGYVELTQAQLKAIREDLSTKCVQFLSHDPKTGDVKVYVDEKADPPRSYVRGRVFTKNVRGFIPRSTDCALDGWLYAREQLTPTIYEIKDPPSLASANPFLADSGAEKKSRK
jgi:hypothetical protein